MEVGSETGTGGKSWQERSATLPHQYTAITLTNRADVSAPWSSVHCLSLQIPNPPRMRLAESRLQYTPWEWDRCGGRVDREAMGWFGFCTSVNADDGIRPLRQRQRMCSATISISAFCDTPTIVARVRLLREVQITGWTSVGMPRASAWGCVMKTKEGTLIHAHKRYSDLSLSNCSFGFSLSHIAAGSDHLLLVKLLPLISCSFNASAHRPQGPPSRGTARLRTSTSLWIMFKLLADRSRPILIG